MLNGWARALAVCIPAKSAPKYAAIWSKDGSPLLVRGQKQKMLLLGYLGQRLKTAGWPADLCLVELGMRLASRISAAHSTSCAPRIAKRVLAESGAVRACPG